MQFRDHPGVQGKRDAYPFDPRLLKIDAAFNVRHLDAPDEREDLDLLKESIRSNGVRVPLEVRLIEDDVFVLSGHRRHKAVMELIAEGVPIKTVPVMPEPKHANDGDRIVNLVVSNSGKPLKPLEVAEVVRRLRDYGWEHAEIAKRLGWKSQGTVTLHLDMIGLPEPVKEQVRDNVISATEAAKVVKNLPKGTDPNLAADLIAKNKEENKKLGVGKKNNHKVTAKTLQRDRPKPPKEEPKPEPQAALSASVAEQLSAAGLAVTPKHEEAEPPQSTVPTPETPIAVPERPAIHPQLQDAAERERRDREWKTAAPPTKADDFDREMFAIIARLATIGKDSALNERSDDELIGVPAEVLKAADRVYRKSIGDDVVEAA